MYVCVDIYFKSFHIFIIHICMIRKAEKLKEKVVNSEDLLNDNEAWLCQQQLQVTTIKNSLLNINTYISIRIINKLFNKYIIS